MKIVYLMSHRELNGVTASGAAQLRALLARGHDVTLVHRPDAWIGKQPFEGSIEKLTMDMGKRLINRNEAARVEAALKAAGTDVVYSHGTQANRIGAMWRRRRAFPSIAKAAARIWHPHWRWHHAVIAPSVYTAEWFRQKHLVRADRLHVVPNFVRDEDIIRRTPKTRADARAALGLAPNQFAICIIGSVDARKNQSAAIPILTELAKRGIRAELFLIGGPGAGEVAKINQLAEAGDVSEQVHVLGHRNDARTLIPGFDAMLCTSRDEQGPVVVIEAMACGLPVLSTNVGMVPTLVEPGVNGEILDYATPDASADYLETLAQDPRQVGAQGQEARTTFERVLAPDRIVDQLEEVFRIAKARAGGNSR